MSGETKQLPMTMELTISCKSTSISTMMAPLTTISTTLMVTNLMSLLMISNGSGKKIMPNSHGLPLVIQPLSSNKTSLKYMTAQV